jgi:hypothetical protein
MDHDMPGGDFRAYPSYPREWESLQAAWMKETFTVPKNWNGKRIVLHFGAVAGDMVATVAPPREVARLLTPFPSAPTVCVNPFPVTRNRKPHRRNQDREFMGPLFQSVKPTHGTKIDLIFSCTKKERQLRA